MQVQTTIQVSKIFTITSQNSPQIFCNLFKNVMQQLIVLQLNQYYKLENYVSCQKMILKGYLYMYWQYSSVPLPIKLLIVHMLTIHILQNYCIQFPFVFPHHLCSEYQITIFNNPFIFNRQCARQAFVGLIIFNAQYIAKGQFNENVICL